MKAPGPGDALLVVDVQNDFLPGGALGIEGGDRVIEPTNRLLEAWRRRGLPVFLSRDWHPPGHCSFEDQGGPWPVHCVGGTPGAEFSSRLRREPGDGRALHLGAVTAAKLGDATRARALSERALAARPDEFATAYNLACAFAVLDDRERALQLLEQATQRDRGNLAWIEQDPDLDSLRGDARFEAIVDRLRAGSGKER
jgi:nicotinamidase/pyrazinamidase